MLGMDDGQKDAVNQFVGLHVDKVPPQPHAHASVVSHEQRLFPGLDQSGMAQAQAAELVSTAMAIRQKKKNFGSIEKFMDDFVPVIRAYLRGDSDRAESYFDYFCFVIRLFSEQSWPAAEYYHWALFTKIERGTHNLETDGPVDFLILREVDQKWGKSTQRRQQTTRGASTGAARSTKARGPLQECKLHGWCAHSFEDCINNTANGGDGQKSQYFRADKPKRSS